MVLRAKFENLEEQRRFFIAVKKKLGMGSTRLARKLGMPNRVKLDWWSLGKSSPELETVIILSEISGIKPSFDISRGPVTKKSKSYVSMSAEESLEFLKKKLGWKGLKLIKEMLDKGKPEKPIMSELRGHGLRFDTSVVSTAIGSLRRGIAIQMVDDIEITNGTVVFRGNVRRERNVFSVTFSSRELLRILNGKKTRIGVKLSKDLKRILIFPLNAGRILDTRSSGYRMRIALPLHVDLSSVKKLEVLINCREFSIAKSDLIQDKDGRILGRAAENMGITISPYRITAEDRIGDLLLERSGKRISIEVTRGKHPQAPKFKLGQCTLQSILNQDAIRYLVCRYDFLNETYMKAFESIGMRVIMTNFRKHWEYVVLRKILKDLSDKH
ncbi:MAG TPA: hypothetical protein VJH90_02150 [archaeon]|nr:hypothetical protein [archaeon]